MAGAMRKMAVYLGLVEDDADEYGDDEHEIGPRSVDDARQPARRFEEPPTTV
ncbi:MAG: cell division protein SepF, partial [Motilibacteraceae bacterium]